MENQGNLENNDVCDEKGKMSVVPYLEADIISNIFTRLPACKVQKLRYSCKEWYGIMNWRGFIDANLYQSKPNLLAVPTNMTRQVKEGCRHSDPNIVQIKDKKDSIRSLRLKRGKSVEGSCNGLLLLEDRSGKLSVSNPVTGLMHCLPPCIQRRQNWDVSRGITFIDSTGEYKVVSVVVNKVGSIGCEVLTLGCSRWKWVDSRFRSMSNVCSFGAVSTPIKGVFHFMFKVTCAATLKILSTYVVSFDTVSEKFYKSNDVPRCRMEALHEINGCVSIIIPNLEFRYCSKWDVMVLQDLSKGEWVTLYTVNLTLFRDKYPLNWFCANVVATFRNGRFFILQRGRRYVYDIEKQTLRSLELEPEVGYCWRPHVESLVWLL